LKLLYQAVVPPDVAEALAHLAPGLKRSVKAALRALAGDPSIGEPLHGELADCRKYRVRRYRIVYRIDRPSRQVRVLAVGHRRSIYDELTGHRDEGK
jgi:mRNA interferase RelE/StbE